MSLVVLLRNERIAIALAKSVAEGKLMRRELDRLAIA